MHARHLVSASLSADIQNTVLQKLSEIRGLLGFLVTLDPEQAKILQKTTSGLAPFIANTYGFTVSHPDLLPNSLSMEEYAKDIHLVQDLHPIHHQVKGLEQSLNYTLIAANSDALVQSLDVYSAVKQHSTKSPRCAAAQKELSMYFQLGRRRPPSSLRF